MPSQWETYNGDGKLDFVTPNQERQYCQRHAGQRQQQLQQSSFIAVGNSPSSRRMGDFNGDGIQDLAVGKR